LFEDSSAGRFVFPLRLALFAAKLNSSSKTNKKVAE
jgi:hypothetical protein